MDKYKCSCCGGNINRATMICEYCGTRYKEEYGNVFRVETFQNPVRTLASRVVVDNFAMRTDPQGYSEFAIKQLARQFAECIAPYMDLEYSVDAPTRTARLDAKIKVVEPIHKATDVLANIFVKGDKE